MASTSRSDGCGDPEAGKDRDGSGGFDNVCVLSHSLSHPDDTLHLSELFCFVRCHIEAFSVSPDGKTGVGRVGLRCIHCAQTGGNGGGGRGAPLPLVRASRDGAVAYPKATRMVYPSVRRWQRNHFADCPAVPREVKERYASLKTPEGRARPKKKLGVSAERYWQNCCERMGMIDTDDGIKLRTGQFIVDDKTLGEQAKEAVGSDVSLAASDQVSVSADDEENVHHATASTGENCLTTPAGKNEGTKIPVSFSSAQDKRKKENSIQTNAVGQDNHSDGPLISFPLPKDELMERISFARRLAQSMSEVSPPTEDDQSSDLFDLGEELFELFTGRQPLGSENGGLVCFGSSGQDRLESSDGFRTDDDIRNMPQKTKREKVRKGGSYGQLSDLGFPSALCCVVSNLLGEEKDGYQSIQQVEEDLRLMAETPEKYLFGNATGNIHLDLANISFCGREEEKSQLLAAFGQATDENVSTNNMVLVTGYSGTGKSSLIQHMEHSFVAKGACFVSGKFDATQQLRQPFSAIASAMNKYCDILALDEDRIESVKEAVTTSVGTEGHILADLIPNLHKIACLGNTPATQMRETGALQRLFFAFRMLFWATCSTSHPVVVFLDDLQWADKVSLELMQVLVTDTMIEGLLFVGSYRDNEVGTEHPLFTHLGNIRRSGFVDITSIHLGNLDVNSVISMVSDTLHLMPGTVKPLAEAVLKKTDGNALFTVQFLASLHDVGLLLYSLASKRWEWDIDGIRDQKISDNVIELMVVKLLRLAPGVQEALSVAASFGTMSQESLFRIIDRSPERQFESTVLSLDVAVSEGLMLKSEGSVYRFSHDQIQRAAYLLIPEPDRDKFHLRIGRLLWKASSSEELEKYLFVVVDQLHRGSNFITDSGEKTGLAELSLLAGQMATAMSSFVVAAAYLKAGIGLLTDDDWVGQRNLCFDLYNLCAEAEYAVGAFDGVRVRLERVLHRTVTQQEKLRPYATLVKALLAQGLSRDAMEASMQILAILGESFPEVVTPQALEGELVATQRLLELKGENELRNLEIMQYAEKEETMKFLALLAECAFQTKKEYFSLVALRMVRLSLLHGISKESALCFAWFGVILCGDPIRDFHQAYFFAKLSLHVLERLQANVYFAKIYVTIYTLIHPWVQPLELSLPCLERAVDVGLATGDTYSAFMASGQYVGAALGSTGKPLGLLWKESDLLYKRIGGYEQHVFHPNRLLLKQVFLNLLGKSDDPSDLMGVGNSEEGLVSAMYSFYSMQLCYLFGHYDRAAQFGKKIEDVFAKIFSASVPLLVINCTFFSGLTALALARRDGLDQYGDKIDKAIAQMEVWAKLCEWNNKHKLELMIAEYASVQGDPALAAKAFDSAEKNAAKHSFIRDRALTLERAGIFYSGAGDHCTAAGLFTKAFECYTNWNAYAKAKQVQEMYL